MAIKGTIDNYITVVGFQLLQESTNIPILATDAIAAEVNEAITGSRGDITGYNWTPLSSYLSEMRTKIAKQQLFDGCSD